MSCLLALGFATSTKWIPTWWQFAFDSDECVPFSNPKNVYSYFPSSINLPRARAEKAPIPCELSFGSKSHTDWLNHWEVQEHRPPLQSNSSGTTFSFTIEGDDLKKNQRELDATSQANIKSIWWANPGISIRIFATWLIKVDHQLPTP